jgi:hypothetical protein
MKRSGPSHTSTPCSYSTRSRNAGDEPIDRPCAGFVQRHLTALVPAWMSPTDPAVSRTGTSESRRPAPADADANKDRSYGKPKRTTITTGRCLDFDRPDDATAESIAAGWNNWSLQLSWPVARIKDSATHHPSASPISVIRFA